MYHRKIPQMFSRIKYGSRIEDCIIVYSIYKDRQNAISVFVGKTPSKQTDAKESEIVSTFMHHHPMLSWQYEYNNFCWPCAEDKRYLVAVFKCRSKIIDIKPAKTVFPIKDNGESFTEWIANE